MLFKFLKISYVLNFMIVFRIAYLGVGTLVFFCNWESLENLQKQSVYGKFVLQATRRKSLYFTQCRLAGKKVSLGKSA